MTAENLRLEVADERALAAAIQYYSPQFAIERRDDNGVVLRRRRQHWTSLASLHLAIAALFQVPPDPAALAAQAMADGLRQVDPAVQEIRLTIAKRV